MQQARIARVQGNQIFAGGRWLTAIGNKTMRPGDIVWIAPGERHWHGAAPTTAMTHIAIQEARDGKAADWYEHVSDEDYGASS